MTDSVFWPTVWFGVGAVTAALSLILGGWVFFRLLEHRERRRLRQEQLAALVSLAYETEQWLRRLRSAELMNGPPLEEPSPMSRVNMIADLFVPELKAEVKRLNTAAVAYETWLEQAVGEKRSQRSVSQATLERYAEVQRAVLERVKEVARKAESLVKG